MRRPRLSPALLLVPLLLLGGAVLAQNIAYTVQVVAVSDQAQAFSLVRELGVEGYPAYATRTTTEQGDVVRVRVGGFANRAAALLYAESMPDFPAPGSRPLPALADNIPAGVMPLEPRLLLDTGRSDLRLLAWGGGLGLEYAPAADGLRHYRLLLDGNSVEFTAWLAWPEPDGLVLRFRDFPLWPAGWQQLEQDQLAQAASLALETVEGRLGMEAGSLQESVLVRDGVPALVVLERFNPWQSVTVGQLLDVMTDGVPESAWPDRPAGAPGPEPEVEVLVADPADLSAGTVEGDGWTVVPDGTFMLQSTPSSTRSWRAAVGAPLWSDGTHLLARHQDRLLLYDFVPRP